MRWSRVLNVVECHAAGEIGKVVTGGVGDVPGSTMFEKRTYLEQNRDDIRKLLLFEPRSVAAREHPSTAAVRGVVRRADHQSLLVERYRSEGSHARRVARHDGTS